MDSEQCKTKLLGFGFSILEGVDPNKENYVCASILHTREAQIGCLMRLEPNGGAQVCINIDKDIFKLFIQHLLCRRFRRMKCTLMYSLL